MKQVKGLRSTHWQLRNSDVDGKHRLENTGRDTGITTRSARWVPDSSGDHFLKDRNVEALCRAPEINIK